jgi:hypothetical protein
MPAGTLLGSGLGFGSRTLPGIPNCLQVLLCDPESRGVAPSSSGSGFRPDADRVTVLRFEVDDQSPEEFAQGQDALRRTPGVLSVTAFPGLGKKGRPTFGVEVLAQPASALAAVDACFRETTTLGLRWQDCGRWVLRRRTEHVDTPAGRLEVKLAVRPDGVAVKAGADQVAAIPGHRARVDARRRAEQEALRQETHGD